MHTQRLQPRDTAEAAEILRRGGLLGIPTETVYGLGANGLNPDAVGHIFAAKGRPQDNPLILHIPSADWLERYCVDIPDTAYALAERFWPGPLTMVLRRKRVVPDVVTAGLDTVGMRCPAHPVCRAILAAADVPVAAPSGNTSGRPSPTNMADMLEDMDGKSIAPIVATDGRAVTLADWMEKHPDIKLDFETLAASGAMADEITSVEDGVYDAAYLSAEQANAILDETGYDDLTITDRVDGRDTAFLINKDQTELQEAVNKAIDALTEDGTLSKLTEEFFGEDNFEVAKELGLRD